MANDSNIYQRMLLVMKEIGSLQKDRKNQSQGYEYLSEEAVKKGVHQALVKHNVLFSLSGRDHELISREGTTSAGKAVVTTFSNMTFDWSFINVDKPEERITGEWRSSAADNSDKSHTKAITYAIREIFKSQFVISTGELNSDPDGETPEVAPATKNWKPLPNPNPSTVEFDSDYGIPPFCPEGHGAMRLRRSKTNDSSFWGCTKYPECKKTMHASLKTTQTQAELVMPPTPPLPIHEEPSKEEINLEDIPF